jgi:uncharacterized protein (TIGR02118 family)
MPSRRTVTAALAGFSALSTLLAKPLSAADKAAGEKAARHCLTVLYAWQADARFDFDYYQNKHLVMLAELYGKGVGKMQVRKGLRKGDGSAPAYIASVSIEIPSMEAFEAAGKEHFPKLLADIPNYTNLTAVAQIEEIL